MASTKRPGGIVHSRASPLSSVASAKNSARPPRRALRSDQRHGPSQPHAQRLICRRADVTQLRSVRHGDHRSPVAVEGGRSGEQPRLATAGQDRAGVAILDAPAAVPEQTRRLDDSLGELFALQRLDWIAPDRPQHGRCGHLTPLRSRRTRIRRHPAAGCPSSSPAQCHRRRPAVHGGRRRRRPGSGRPRWPRPRRRSTGG